MRDVIMLPDIEFAVKACQHCICAVYNPGVGYFRPHDALVGDIACFRLVCEEMRQILVASRNAPDDAVLAHCHGAYLPFASRLAQVDKGVFLEVQAENVSIPMSAAVEDIIACGNDGSKAIQVFTACRAWYFKACFLEGIAGNVIANDVAMMGSEVDAAFVCEKDFGEVFSRASSRCPYRDKSYSYRR